MKLHSFSVTGGGEFPLDMLRYDSCFPATSEDASKMHGYQQKRTINLTTCSAHAPTTARWASFMWSVKDKS